jgi:hypothetical protein
MRALIGLFLLMWAIVFLLFSIAPAVLEDSQAILNVLEGIYCDPGDTISARRIITHDSDGTGYSAEYTCMRPNETTYDATGKSILITIVGFTVPLFLSIMFFSSIASKATGRVAAPTYQGQPVMISGAGVIAATDLKSRLQQLDEAYNQHLLSKAEYDRMRQDILNEF